MKKQLSKIAILLVITMCLPLLAACDVSQFIGFQPTPPTNDGKVEDKTEAENDVQDDELPKGMQMALGSDNNSYRVSSYKGTEENLVIPETYNGFPVTEIDENAFMGNKKLVSVVIPDSVEIIGNSAFKNCQKLETVTIGEYASMLCEIGKQAFFGCTTLESIEFVGDEYTWNSVEKGKDWDKNAGMKTDDKTYEMVFIAPSEPPIETKPVETQPVETQPVYTETEEVSTPTVETSAPDNGECNHEKITIPGVAPTCTESGYLEGVMCAKCGIMITVQAEIPAIGHIWDNGTTNGDVTCGDTANIAYKCKVCGETRVETGDVLLHVWYEYAYTEPTCETNGLASYRCSRYGCNETKTEIVDALGHEYGEGSLSIYPTCSTEGLMKFYCTRSGCNYHITEPVEINPIAHSMMETSKAPGFNTPGYEKHYKCEYCGYLIDPDGNAIDAPVEIAPVGGSVGDCEAFFDSEALAAIPFISYAQGSSSNRPFASSLSEDGSFVRFERTGEGQDGNITLIDYNLNHSYVTGQYLVFKYRTGSEKYIAGFASTTASINGRAMYRIDTTNDNEWHIAIVDLSKSLSEYVVANSDGEYSIQWLRMDILDDIASEGYIDLAWVALCDNPVDVAFAMTEEDKAVCPHILAENAEYTDNGDYHYTTCLLCGGDVKYAHSISTEPVYDSETKLYKGACACGKEMTSEMIYITEARATNDYANCITVSQEDGFVRYTAIQGRNNDVYFYPYINGTEVTGKYMVITYRLVNNGKNASKKSFFAGSLSSTNSGAAGNGDHQNTVVGSKFFGDGEWHCMIIFPKAENTQFTDDTWKYLRIGFTPDAYDGSCYLDIAEIAFADSMVAAENYAMNHDEAPYYIGNIDKGNCSLNGEVITESARGESKPIALDLEGKTLNSADSLVLGGWCCVAGGISSYNIRVTSIDGEAVEAPELIKWGNAANRTDIYTAIGKAQGFSDACATGAGMNKSAVDLSAWAGHDINFEVVAISNYGAELVIVQVNNVTVPTVAE